MNLNQPGKLLLSTAALMLIAPAVRAGDIVVTPSVVARYDNAIDFNLLPLVSPPGGPILDGPGLYQVDLTFQVLSLDAGEIGFAALSFDTVLVGNVNVGFAYSPDTSVVDINGAAPLGIQPKWNANQDAGAAGDLQAILVATQHGVLGAFDPRDDLGQPDPEYFGTLFLQVGPTGGQVQFGNCDYSFRNAGGDFLKPVENQFITPIVFGVAIVPEPTGIALILLTVSVAIPAVRRRSPNAVRIQRSARSDV